MPRPSIKEERREQILDAFETCVARFGLEGATLERIAEEAGLARALIRHNVGNREDLIDSLIKRFLSSSKDSLLEMYTHLPETNKVAALVELLFDPTHYDPKLVQVSEALIAASASNAVLAKKMRKWTADFVKAIETIIINDYPNAAKETALTIATGITGIYFTVESMSHLGRVKGFNQNSKQAAQILIDSLEA